MSSINTNLIALDTQNNLKNSQSALATAIQRLSTGLKINSAKDDPAGLAIASRMKAQLGGLTQAASNASEGISMLQTAEGGLAESTKLLIQMRDKVVQAANGTNSATDRASLQVEITQLKAEFNRIANTTQYNGINLLDGSLSNVQFQVGANAGQTISFGIANAQQNALGNNAVSLTGAAGHTAGSAITEAGTLGTAAGAVNNVKAQILSVQGSGTTQTINIADSATALTVAAAFNSATSSTGITATASTTAALAFTTAGTQSFTINGQQVTTSWSSDYTSAVNAINQQTGVTGVTASLNGVAGITLSNITGANIAVANTSAVNTLTLAGTVNTGTQAAPVMTAGTAVTLTTTATAATVAAVVGGNLQFSSQSGFAVTSDTAAAGLFGVAAGAANGSTLNAVGIIDVTTLSSNGTPVGANNALNIIDAALGQMNTSRGLLGSLQNRFTAAVSSLTTAATNLTSSLSTVQDADFAQETTDLSIAQILQQAGTAMLAQANQLPSGVLALLRG